MDRRITFGLAMTLLCIDARAARADDVAAAALLFEQGVAHMKVNNFEVGCKEIAESVKLDRRPGALYTLARCETDWGRIATAVARYDEYLLLCEKLSKVEKNKQAARMTDAKKRIKELAPEVPYLTVTLAPNAPKSTVIQRNGETFGNTLLGVKLPVDPGVVVFSTQLPKGPVTEKRVEVLKASNNVVVLEVAPIPVIVKPSTALRTAGWVIAGVGGALLGGGLIAGATVVAKRGEVDENCGAAVGYPQVPAQCNDAGREALKFANNSATVANVGVIAGSVGVALGLILVAVAPKPLQPQKAGLVHDVTIELGPSHLGGVMAGFRGTW